MTADELVARLEGARERGPGRWSARCPSHDDKSPSLSVREGDEGTVLLHCFAGCSALDICGAIGVELRDLFPARQIRRVEHSNRPRIPASERLELIEHEVGVAFFIAADFLSSKTIADADWQRLAQAVGRIGNARHG